MSRATHPLKRAAVHAADDDLYANHRDDPRLFDQAGNRKPLDPCDPEQRDLRAKWMKFYEHRGGEVTTGAQSPSEIGDTVVSCPDLAGNPPPPPVELAIEGQLVVTVVDKVGKPVDGATVIANELSRKSNTSGVADFGLVPPTTYHLLAAKPEYTHCDPLPNSIEVHEGDTARGRLGLTPCVTFQVTKKPLLIAVANQKMLPPVQPVSIPGRTGVAIPLQMGDDSFHETGRSLPPGATSVGSDEATLKQKQLQLVRIFAKGDTDGMAKREFEEFQRHHRSLEIYVDPKLDEVVKMSDNFLHYPELALNVPASSKFVPQNKRIHQALEAAGWDVNLLALHRATMDCSPVIPAFNSGGALDEGGEHLGWLLKTGDFGNGLKLMIDAVAHVLIYAESYEFNQCQQQYTITLIFELYDSFGVDDPDVQRFGAGSEHWRKAVSARKAAEFTERAARLTGNAVVAAAAYLARQQAQQVIDAAEGVTAWWQLQHQHGYAPLITKAVVKRQFTVTTTGVILSQGGAGIN